MVDKWHGENIVANEMRPGSRSQSGIVLFVENPNVGKRPAAHLFDLATGGIAWVDHGWTDPLVSFHGAHYLEGRVSQIDRQTWQLESNEREIWRIWVDPESHRPDGDRELALAAITQEFGILLLPDV